MVDAAHDMMGIAPPGRAVTAGKATTAVPCHDCSEDRKRKALHADAVVEYVVVPGTPDAMEVGIAHPGTSRARIDGPTVGRGSVRPAIETGFDDDLDMRAVPGRAGLVVILVEEDEHFEEGVATLAGGIALIVRTVQRAAVAIARSNSSAPAASRPNDPVEDPSGNR